MPAEFKTTVDYGDPYENIGSLEDYVEVWLEQERPCPNCGWDNGRGKGDVYPTEPMCNCWSKPDRPEGRREKC
jgi:hypothetical protein